MHNNPIVSEENVLEEFYLNDLICHWLKYENYRQKRVNMITEITCMCKNPNNTGRGLRI